MGEVYKARDTRLNRTVAIKVLPRQVAADPELRARFEREARVVSSLDHPNICVLHDVGRAALPGSAETAEIEFLVMQFLEGETLAQRLARGPLPLADALRIATEIASALDRAHRAGILHRDLKPGNVMLTKAGSKLLDFGLAKHSVVSEAALPTMDVTVTSPLTGRGTILGTLLYMSPEQLEGREADARSDIFSLGAVAYEMVSGTPPFHGKSQASIIAAILEREPAPLVERAPLTPLALDRVVRKSLEKDPDRRWQSARDLGDELAWIAQGDTGQLRGAEVAAGPAHRRWLAPAIAAAGLLALVAAALVAWSAGNRATPSPTIARHLSVAIPSDLVLISGGVAVSPDGRSLVYIAGPPETALGPDLRARLYLQKSDSDTAAAIPGTEGALSPFFSPDGLWIGFFTPTGLMKVSVLGGAPIKITDTPPVNRGGTWGPNDTIVFAPTQSHPVNRVSAAGGAYTVASKSSHAQLWPEFLPGGESVLFTLRRGTSRNLGDTDLAILDLATGEERVLLQGAGYGRYSPTGHILFTRGATLYAVRFDLKTQAVLGTPLPVVDGLAVSSTSGAPQFAAAPDGTLYAVRGMFPDSTTSAVWVDRSGKDIGRPLASGQRLWGPRLSPDGTKTVLTSYTAQRDSDVFMLDVASASMVRFSGDAADDFNPIWGPAGQSVIYTTFAVGRLPTIVSKPSDGSGKSESVMQIKGPQFTGSVSPSGLLAFTTFTDAGTRSDLYTVELNGNRTPRPFLVTSADEFGPEFSPDGTWIAYISTESGSPDVYVAPFPGPGPKRRLSRGGVSPAWCRSCGELFYQSPAGMMAVRVAGHTFGEPQLLFPTGHFRSSSREDGPRQYDVTADGKRFLMLRSDPATASTARLDVIIDWVSRLTQRTKSGN